MASMLKDEKELEEFHQLMCDLHKFRKGAILTCGSMVEFENNHVSISKFTGEHTLDQDQMIYLRDDYVFSVTDGVPSRCRCQVLRYMSDGRHPGFCHIEKVDHSPYSLQIFEFSDGHGFSVHGPSMRSDSGNSSNVPQSTQQFFAKEIDNVFALHSPYWPPEAVNWISRQRPQGPISQNVIRRVVSYGCDFVRVSHKLHKQTGKDKEFRFSFSIPEFMVIRNWSTQQRIAYRLVKVLYKRSLNKGKRRTDLCTYYFKTLMLWAVDTRPQRSWNDVIYSTRYVFLEMIRCLKNKCLLHYFIPECNLLDHLDSIDLISDSNALCEIVNKVFTSHNDITELFKWCSDEEVASGRIREICIVPAFVISSLNYFRQFFPPRTISSTYQGLSDGLSIMSLSNIVKLLTKLQSNIIEYNNSCCLRNVKSSRLDQKEVAPTMVAQYLHVGPCGNRASFNLICGLLTKYYEIIARYDDSTFLSQCLPLIRSSTRMHGRWITLHRALRPEGLDRVYNRLTTVLSQTHYERDANENNAQSEPLNHYGLDNIKICHLHSISGDSVFKIGTKYFGHKPGISPTVPVSWFINKAYTANHYYTLLSFYKTTDWIPIPPWTTEKICDEIIDAYNESEGNKEFAERGLPVLLSTRWIKMYDREIQKLLGLSALCRFVAHESGDRSVDLPVCPVEYAHYLKCRNLIDTEGPLSDQTHEAMEKSIEHGYNCLPYEYIYGSSILKRALKKYFVLVLSRELEICNDISDYMSE